MPDAGPGMDGGADAGGDAGGDGGTGEDAGPGCTAPAIACGADCVETASDRDHCGGCDAACEDGEVCSEGSCAPDCAAGLTDCGGACVDTATAPRHCGACDDACPTPPGAVATCAAGGCGVECRAENDDCNDDLDDPSGDGCETRTASDTANCGACGTTCAAVDNGTTGCNAGTCGVGTCDTGFGDCDGLAANGCETNVMESAIHCRECGTVCPGGESCVAGACHLVTGDTCGSAIALTTGVNTIAWTAFSTDYLAASPSCASSYTTTGPDLVLTYTATGSELVTMTFQKPTSTRWVAVLSTEPCGTFGAADACVAEFSFTEMSASIWLDAGETVYAYLVDTTSGAAPLDNPLTVTVTATTPPCSPGAGGIVGRTTARVPTAITTFFSEYYVAVDQSPTGYVYVGGISSLYRLPKAGGTVENVYALAGLTSLHVGYAMLVDGSNIYTLDTASGTSGRLYRISSNGGATWAVQDYASFATAPGDDFRALTRHGSRIYLLTEESSTTVATEVWSVDATATTLPTAATLERTFTGESYCTGLARDDFHYYVACNTSRRLLRVPVSGTAAPELVTTEIPIGFTANAILGDDTNADGAFDVLYVHADREEIYFVCNPGSATPFAAPHTTLGGATANYGMGYDRTAGVLWTFDDDDRAFVSVE